MSKDYIKKINITAYWDDDFGNIDYRANEESHRVNISGHGLKNWDPIYKLDFFKDLENWVQEEVDKIHEKLGEGQSFVHSYVMHCPKSSKQFQEEQKDPTLNDRRQKLANEIRMKTNSKIFKPKGADVIQFKPKG